MATSNTARATTLPACDDQATHGSRVSRILAGKPTPEAQDNQLQLGHDHARTLRISRQLKRRK